MVHCARSIAGRQAPGLLEIRSRQHEQPLRFATGNVSERGRGNARRRGPIPPGIQRYAVAERRALQRVDMDAGSALPAVRPGRLGDVEGTGPRRRGREGGLSMRGMKSLAVRPDGICASKSAQREATLKETALLLFRRAADEAPLLSAEVPSRSRLLSGQNHTLEAQGARGQQFHDPASGMWLALPRQADAGKE